LEELDVMLLIRAVVLAMLFCGVCFAEPMFAAKQLHFKSLLGSKAGDKTVYCLVGLGLIMAPRTDDVDQLVTAWLSDHPNAQVTLIDTSQPIGRPGSAMGSIGGSLQYIWIENGNENLNVFLVREGAVPAGVMADPASFMTSLKQPLAAWEKPPTRLVTDEKYDDFMKRVVEAEELAKRDKKGLWSGKYKELMDSFQRPPAP
jgi:hypothetical protein